jgi:hypothetical protein
MTVTPSPSRIRQRIDRLLVQRHKLERALLGQRHSMLDACLVARRRLAGGKIRKTPAFYLSRKVQGKTTLTYVRKEDLPNVRRQTDRWRRFSSALAQWVRVNDEIERSLRALGKVHLAKRRET